MMEDSRFTGLQEALTRFIERLKWLRPFQGAEDPATLEEARGALDEWALLEPHMELLEAVVGRPEMAGLQVRLEAMRVQVRREFLLAVGRLLQVMELSWMNEMLMRVPAALKKLPDAEEQSPAVANALSKLRGLLKEWMGAADRAGEDMWRLPLNARLRDQLKSNVADMRNTGDRFGGAITAGLFLKTFAKETPWVHVDIAGPASLASARPSVPRGGTGFAVATIVEYLAKK